MSSCLIRPTVRIKLTQPHLCDAGGLCLAPDGSQLALSRVLPTLFLWRNEKSKVCRTRTVD